MNLFSQRTLGALVVLGVMAAPAMAGVTGAGGGTQTSTTTRTEVHTQRVTSTSTQYLAPIIRDLGNKVVKNASWNNYSYNSRYASDWRTSYYLQTGHGGLGSYSSTSFTGSNSYLSFLRNNERVSADTHISDSYTKTGETLDRTESTKTVTDSPDLIIIGDPEGGNGYVAQGSRHTQLDITDYIWDNLHKTTTRQQTIDKWREYQHNTVYNYTVTTTYYGVTPIVLNLDGSGKLGASNGNWLPHEKTMYGPLAVFDFYGSGEPVLMEWVAPKDGLLVRVKEDGTVDGTCFFGSSNGFENGFEELATLDANRDNRLTGEELAGLSVWQDANSNAIAGATELKSVQDLGITEIRLDHKNLESTFVMNGREMKMWDWNPLVKKLQRQA